MNIAPLNKSSSPLAKAIGVEESQRSQSSRQIRRQETMKLLFVRNEISAVASGQNCFRSARGFGNSGVALNKITYHETVRASWNKQTCKSALCPRCAVVSQYKRRRALRIASEKHISSGGTVLALTLTMKTQESITPQFSGAEFMFRKSPRFDLFTEDIKDLRTKERNALLRDRIAAYKAENPGLDAHLTWDLNTRRDALQTAYKATFGGGAWTKERSLYSVVGHLSVVELVAIPRVVKKMKDWGQVTHNLHFHIAIFVAGTMSPKIRMEWENNIRGRWIRGVAKAGFHASPEGQYFDYVAGKDIEKITHYLTKISDDVSGLSKPKKGSLSIFDALKDVEQTGSLTAENWYKNVELVMKGRKSFMMSQRFYENLDVAAEVEADGNEFVENSVMEPVLTFTQSTWLYLSQYDMNLKFQLPNMVENGPVEEVFNHLDSEGYSYIRPDMSPLAPASIDEITESEW